MWTMLVGNWTDVTTVGMEKEKQVLLRDEPYSIQPCMQIHGAM